MHEKLWKIPTRYGTNISSAFWGAPFIFGKLWIITRSYDYPVVFLCIGPVYIIVVYQSRSISKKQDPLSTRKPPIYYHLAGACLFNKWIWKKKLETGKNKIKWFYFAKQKSLNAYNGCLFFPLCFHCDAANFRGCSYIFNASTTDSRLYMQLLVNVSHMIAM